MSHLAWNVGGLALPLVVAVFTVPLLIEKLGHERFGLLALAWGLIGYAGALDLGIGRALTQKVSQLRGETNLALIPDVLATAGRMTLMAGLAGGFLIAVLAWTGAGSWIRVESTPPGEITNALLLLAVALPAQAMTATYKGMNEAFLRFMGVNLLRVGLGIVNFGGPYVVALFTPSLPWLVLTLVASRLLALLVFRRLAISCLESLHHPRRIGSYSPGIARSLFAFGGWVTVSSIVSPVLVQADRFVIASALSAAAVSAYVLPYEVVVQSLILVGAVTSVMFPGLSRTIREKPDQWQPYFRKWLRRVGGLMALVCIALAVLLPLLLPPWIQGNLDPASIKVGQILCLGVFANAIGSMFYALLHARGRPDISARLHLIELPLFICALLLLVDRYGVVGAAWAWVGRMLLDAAALACWNVARR
ncbi:oligosaccharide flippase family protein [Variovorax sp. PBS-H4]|uniref:oligosaccharide flippase family protein n=1 Tax=Variovorax sp. PBS-H4 TaxID=434008 RepID=UPI001E3CE32E|nr:oligosaccharide flippase family protein [Variovorax sp. PBS-H4]